MNNVVGPWIKSSIAYNRYCNNFCVASLAFNDSLGMYRAKVRNIDTDEACDWEGS